VESFPPAFPVWLAALLGAWLVLGAGVYFCLVRLVAKQGGKVSTREFGPQDNYVAGAFVLWFLMIVANGFGGPEHDVTKRRSSMGRRFSWGS